MKYLTTTEIEKMNSIASRLEDDDIDLWNDYDAWCEAFTEQFGDERLEILEDEGTPYDDWLQGFTDEETTE